ncbi:MAG: hypothetical protein WAU70_04995 [Flavobacteriales bacterium]
MKRLFAPVLFLPLIALAQDDIGTKLTEVRAPQSPAAALLGMQPNVINRPKSWQALETALYTNFFSNNSFSVPNDFALEFTPFWAGKKKTMSMERFLQPSGWEAFQRNTSISIASTQNFLIGDSVKTNAIGIGLRTLIVDGSKAEKERTVALYKATLKGSRYSSVIFRHIEKAMREPALRAANADRAALVAQVNTELDAAQNALMASFPDDKAEVKRAIADVKAYIEQDAPDAAFGALNPVRPADNDPNAPPAPPEPFDTISDYLDQYLRIDENLATIEKIRNGSKGFRVELAGSLMCDFPTNENDLSYVAKGGIWLTPSYQPINSESFEFLGVCRVLWYHRPFYEKYDPDAFTFEQNIDYGLRLVYKRPKFSIEAEAIGRSSSTVLSDTTDEQTGITTRQTKSEADFQYLLNLNYELTETITLTYMFGKQLDPVLNLDVNGDVISLLSLNLGLGGPTSSTTKGLVRY